MHTDSVSVVTDNQYFIKNHLGSTVTLVDKDAQIVAPVYDYFPYGKQKIAVNAPVKVTQTFTGKELDLFDKDLPDGEDGEGWYYFGARYYDSDIGLWISCDPKREFWSPYRYTTNPIAFLDPTGLSDVHFMLGGTTNNGVHMISMAKFRNQMSGAAKIFDEKGYSVQFDYLNKNTLETALNENSLYIYSLSHGNELGQMQGRIQSGKTSHIMPEEVNVSEGNTTVWRAYGCKLANGIQNWISKVPFFQSWFSEKTNTNDAPRMMNEDATFTAKSVMNKKED